MELRQISDEELRSALERHWKWLESRGTKYEPARLDHLDLRGYNLPKIAFNGADLTGTDLTGSDLTRSTFGGANLTETILDNATLRYTSFPSVDFRQTRMRGAQLYGANLSDANLQGVALADAHLMDATLQRADLRQAYLTEANLIGSNLIEADLSGAELFRARFTKSRLAKAKFRGAKLREANFEYADLSGADLSECELIRAEFFAATMTGTNLEKSDLTSANFYLTHLEGANFRQTTLAATRLIEANLRNADLSGARVFGASVWKNQMEGAVQKHLLVTPPTEPDITVDDLEIAQFIYLLLSREKLRNVIDTITSKAVLILGRFTPDRKPVLEAMAEELRARNLLPIIFDFERATSLDFTETIKTLAGLCFFVIADLTNPKSAPLELQAIVPDYQIPFVTIIQEGEKPFSMFEDLARHDWVLQPVIAYKSLAVLRQAFDAAILNRAFEKHKELRQRKAQHAQTMSVAEFLQQGPSG